MITMPVPEPVWFETIDGKQLFYRDGKFREVLPSVTIECEELVRVQKPRRWWEFFKAKEYREYSVRHNFEVLEDDLDYIIEDLEFNGVDIIEVRSNENLTST